MARLIAIVIGLTALLALPAGAWAARKVALVIGINDYQNVQKLTRADNDATATARELETMGFDVILQTDPDRRAISEAMTRFEDQLHGAEVGLFYFAGHGVEIRGQNILLPADLPSTLSESVVMREGLLMSDVAQLMSNAGVRFPVLIIDACRDNPLPHQEGRSVGRTRGLGRADVPLGTYVVYSAGIGETALDSLSESDDSKNGLFTRFLLPALDEPGISLDAAVKQVREKVRLAAATVNHQQNPAVYDQATGEVFLLPRAAQPAAPTIAVAPDASGMEALFWQSVQGSNRPSELEAYLDRFPNGVFAPLARDRLAAMRAASPTLATAPTTPAPALSPAPALAPPSAAPGSAPPVQEPATAASPVAPPAAEAPAAPVVAAPAIPAPASPQTTATTTAAAATTPLTDRDGIREAQRRLGQLGLDPGPATGMLTPQTRTAIRAFETAAGLAPKGYLTGALMERLRVNPPAAADLTRGLLLQARLARERQAAAEAIRLSEAGLRLSPQDPEAARLLAETRQALATQAAQRQVQHPAGPGPVALAEPAVAAPARKALEPVRPAASCGVSFAGSRVDAGLAGYTFTNSCSADVTYSVKCENNSNIGKSDRVLHSHGSTTVWVEVGRHDVAGACEVVSSKVAG